MAPAGNPNIIGLVIGIVNVFELKVIGGPLLAELLSLNVMILE